MMAHIKYRSFCLLTTLLLIWFDATATRAQKPELVLQSGHHDIIRALAISPDGKYLASAGVDRTIIIWDIPAGRQIISFKGHDEFIFSLAFSPDGNRLASASGDGIVNVWNVAKGVREHQATLQESGVTSLAFSPDGKMLAISCADKRIMLWYITQKRAGTLSGYNGAVTQIAFSPDGKYLASTGRDKRDGLTVWNLATDKTEFSWAREDEGYTSLAFSPDGRYIAAACKDESISVWDTRDWKAKAFIPPAGVPDEIRKEYEKKNSIDHRVLRRLFGDSGFVVGSLVFTSNKELTFTDSFRIRTWDVEVNKEVPSREMTSEQGSYVVTVNKAGSLLAFNEGPDIRLLDLRTKQLRELKGAANRINAIDLIFGGRALAALYGDQVGVWNYGGHLTKPDWNRVQVGLSGYIGTLIPSTGEFACHCGGRDDAKIIKLLDISNLKPRASLKGHDKPVTSATVHPDGNMLASCSGDNTIKLWDVKKRTLIKTIQQDADLVAFSPDGKLLASAGSGTVTFWQVDTWGRHSEKLPTVNALKILFSPDSRVLATTGMTDFRKHLILWNTSTSKILHSLVIDSTPEDRNRITRVQGEQNNTTIQGEMKTNITASGPMAFSHDSRFIASEEINRTTGTHKIKIWDVNTGVEVHTLAGHDAPIRAMVFTPDDKVLVSGGWDKKIKFWDKGTGTELATFVPLDKEDWVIFTPDGRFDTNMSLDNVERLHWIMPGDALNPLPLDIFMRDYYEPKLLERILAGAAPNPVRDISTLNRTQPYVRIKEVKPDGTGTVEVMVEVENAVSRKQFDAKGHALQSSVYDVRLFRDGQMVGNSTTEIALETYIKATGDLDQTASFNESELRLWRQAHQVRLDENGRGTFVFRNIKLPQGGKSKEAVFSAYAFNNDRVKSATVRTTYALPSAPSRPRKGRAYIVTMGVNLYENSDFNLYYAANDARQTEQALTSRLAATGQYEEVVPVSLISDNTRGEDGTVRTRIDATKANFRAVLRLLSGAGGGAPPELRDIPNADKLKPATPDDFILILFAGHGFTGPKGLFYLVPYDTGRGKGVTALLQQRSISSDELSLWLRDIDAGHLALIVDACHSAAAVESAEFKPGPMGSRGFGQLAYDKGMLILAATQADKAALEGGRIRQGLLSYVLIKEGLEEKQADFDPADGTIMLREWLRYGVLNVPRLFQEVIDGKTKVFGRDVFVDSTGRPRSDQQQPLLFDFTHRRADVTLMRRTN